MCGFHPVKGLGQGTNVDVGLTFTLHAVGVFAAQKCGMVRSWKAKQQE